MMSCPPAPLTQSNHHFAKSGKIFEKKLIVLKNKFLTVLQSLMEHFVM